MSRFLRRRLIHAVFTLIGVSLLAFVLIDLAPGQYFQEMRLEPQISPATLTALRHQYGLDQPLPLRYMRWFESLCRGELGFSFAHNSPVWPLLRPRLRNTLILTGTALVFSWLIAIVFGVWGGSRRQRWEGRILGLGTSVLISVPDVLIGLALLALTLHTHWFPLGGMISLPASSMGILAKLRDSAWHLILPILALVFVTVPVLLRHVQSAIAEVWDSSYIRAARGHGIPRRRLIFRYALPAAANPLISLGGVSVGILLGGSLLVEVIMGWPGIGPLLLQSILERDPYVVVAVVMISALLLIAGNMVADISLYITDPRIRKD